MSRHLRSVSQLLYFSGGRLGHDNTLIPAHWDFYFQAIACKKAPRQKLKIGQSNLEWHIFSISLKGWNSAFPNPMFSNNFCPKPLDSCKHTPFHIPKTYAQMKYSSRAILAHPTTHIGRKLRQGILKSDCFKQSLKTHFGKSSHFEELDGVLHCPVDQQIFFAKRSTAQGAPETRRGNKGWRLCRVPFVGFGNPKGL